MRSYNGFSPAERTTAGRWLRRQWASGALQRPQECVFCGQRQGVLHAHAEDYSGPDSTGAYPRAGEFPACYRCHMMLHSRFKAPEAFETYCKLLEDGYRWTPLTQADFGAIKRFLARHQEIAGQTEAIPSQRTGGDPGLLRRIAAGEYRPPARAIAVPGRTEGMDIPYAGV